MRGMPWSRWVAWVAAVLFAVLAVAVAARDGAPFAVDTAVHDWALARRTPMWTEVFTAVTGTGAGLVPYLLAALAGALAPPPPGRVWYLGALAGVGALLAGQLVRFAVVNLVDRPRPPAGDWASHVNHPALPSGHATTSALVGIGLAAALVPYCRRVATRALAVAVPAAWAVAVGASRVYLGVHWPTDVLAGWLLATALTAALLPRRRCRTRRDDGAAGGTRTLTR